MIYAAVVIIHNIITMLNVFEKGKIPHKIRKNPLKPPVVGKKAAQIAVIKNSTENRGINWQSPLISKM